MSLSLDTLGWGPALATSFDAVQSHQSQPLVPGRVVRQEREVLHVSTAVGTVPARPSGRLRHAAAPGALPVVGDWVAVTPPGAPGDAVHVHAVLPRRGLLQRREAGEAPAGQPLAAHVDVVLVVAALDVPLNPRRLERALTLAWGAGARPVLVLTKADACADVDAALAQARALAPTVDAVALGLGRDGDDAAAALAPVCALLPPARTGVLLGPSGVGKSTLLNRLLGSARQATGPVRARDAKGRHTTTHRELVALPHGALLVDGPGVRELGLWVGAEEGGTEAGLAATFEDVDALAAACRFGDCGHGAEPGCAVREGVEAGTLPEARLEAWRALQRELAWAHRQVDAGAARAHARQMRRLTQEGWERSRSKRR